MAGSSQGIGVESHNGFNISEHWTGHGGKTESLVWQIEVEMPEEWYREPGPKSAPILVEFDAERKELYIDLEMCKRFGVSVRLLPEMESGEGKI